MKKFILFLGLLVLGWQANAQDLIITGVIDGTLTGGNPKAVELYAVNDIPDLTLYGIGSANNGGGSDGQEFTLSGTSASAGDFLYVTADDGPFFGYFGVAAQYVSDAAGINGDDAIELYYNGSVIDVFGDINVDGSGQPWEYADGWAYRVSGTGPDGTTFVESNWTYSGADALDLCDTDNASCASMFPIGTYMPPAPVTSPTTSAPTPMEDAADVVSIFSDAYTNLPIANYDPNWGQTGHTLVNTMFDPTGTGTDFVMAYPNFNYQGTDFGSNEDLSDMEFLHVDIWVASSVTDRMVKVSPINNGTGPAEVLVEVPVTPGAWNSVTLPKSDFTDPVTGEMTWDSVFQIKFDGQFNADGSANTTPFDIYLDNIYFSKTPSSTTFDDCAGAINLDGVLNSDGTCTLTQAYDNTGATFSSEEGLQSSTCTNASNDTAPPDIWFTLTVPASGEFTFDDIATPGISNVTEFYTGTCGSLTPVAGAPCNNSSSPKTVSGLTPGETVYIRIWDFGQTDFGPGEFCVSFEACPSPSGLAVTNITGDSAQVDWADSPVSNGYEYILALDGDPAPDATSTGTPVGTNTLALDNLSPNTEYTFYVRSDCGSGVLSGWSDVDFSTLCTSFIPDYVEDFSSMSFSAAPNCWSEASNGDPVTGPVEIGTGEWTSDGFLNSGSSGSARINLYNLGTSDWLISPIFDLSGGSYEVVFDIGRTAFSGSSDVSMGSDDEVQLLYSDDGGATWNNLITWNLSNQPSNSGELSATDLSAITGSSVQFAFWASEGTVDDPEDYNIYIDNFEVRTPLLCPEPLGLSVSNITETSVDISWTDDPAATSGYNWSVYMSPSDPAVDTPVDSGTTAAGMAMAQSTLLMSQTDYDVYLSADCGADGQSPLAGPVTFTTPCGAFPINFEEDFTNLTFNVNTSLNCWEEGSGIFTPVGSGGWGNQTFNNDSSNDNGNGNALYTNLYNFGGQTNEFVATPVIDLGAGDPDMYLSYDVFVKPWSGDDQVTDMGLHSVSVVISTDGGATWDLATNTLTTYDTSNIPNDLSNTFESISLAAYSGEIKIGFLTDEEGTADDFRFYIDNLYVGTPPPPASVQVIHNSADPAAEFVDVYVNGVLTLDDFEFRNATPFVDLPSGVPVSIDIAPSTSADVSESLYNLTTTLDAGETYVVVANGVLDPTQFDASVNTIDFELSVFAGAQQASTNAGETSILINHGSTDAPSVDVVEVSVPAGTLADDLAYPQFAGYVDVPTADYIINVELADNSAVVASYQAPLATLGTSDLALTVVASGFLDPAANQNGEAFGLWAALPTGGALVELPLFIPPPANDNACDAIPLTVGAPSAGDAYTNVSATAEANEPVPGCFNGDINGSVWFTFVAPDSGDVTVTTDIAGGTLTDTEIAIYDAPGDCTDLTTFGADLDCDQDGGSVVNFNSIISISGLTPGNTYYVQVDQWGSATPGTFGIRVLDNNPPCPEPSNLSATNITADSATLNWDDVTEATQGYEWFVYASPSDPTVDSPIATGTTGAGVTTADVSGLTPETDYDFYVSSDCDVDGQSILAGPSTFTTGCAAIAPDYEENFDTFLPDCWNEAGSGDPTTGPSDLGTGLWGPDGFLNNGFSGSARINLYTDNREDWLISPAFDLSGGTYELVFDIGITAFTGTGNSAMGSDDEVQLLYSEDGGATWVNLQTWAQGTEPSNAGETLTYDLSALTGTSVQFAFWGTDGSVNDPEDYNVYVDNFEVRTPPNCPEPSNLVVSNVTLDSADLSWDDVVEATNGYVWSIYTSPSDPSEDTPVASGNTAAGMTMDTVTGLMSGTDYDFYLQADCDTNGTSALVGPVTFSTLPDYCGGDLFYDNGGPGANYANNSNETITISPSNAGDVVTVDFLSFSTELNWDGLQIYDGPDTSAPLIDSGFVNPGFGPLIDGTWTGLAGDSSNAEGLTFISTHPTGALTFVFTSDGSFTDIGWEAVVTCGPAPAPASVQVIHNSADPAAQLVDVYVNGALTLDDFAFRTATPFVDLPAETQISIDVAPSTSTDVSESIYNFTGTLASGESYIVVANGVLDPTQFDSSVNTPIAFNLDIFAGAQQASTNPGENSILVHHGATDAPMVDISEITVPLGVVVDDISYTEFQGYLDVPNADYVINVELADNSAVVASYEANLASFVGGNLSDLAITVLASGFLDPVANQNGASFGLWAAIPTGGPLVELPLTTISTTGFEFDNFSFYPNPVEHNLYLQTTSTVEQVKVINMLGQEVLNQLPNNVSPTLNVESLQAGTYIMSVTIDGTVKNFKFVKE
jgi:hypothetical protein